jgi:hypothetical protein
MRIAHTSTKACKSTKERLQRFERESERAREPVRECGLRQAGERKWPHTTRPRYKDRLESLA